MDRAALLCPSPPCSSLACMERVLSRKVALHLSLSLSLTLFSFSSLLLSPSVFLHVSSLLDSLLDITLVHSWQLPWSRTAR